MTYEKCPFCQNIHITSAIAPGVNAPENLQRKSDLTDVELAKMYEINHRYREACGQCLTDGRKVAEAFGLL